MMEDLNPLIRDQIDLQFIESKNKLEVGEKAEAIQKAEAAWKMLPEPKFGWDVSKSFTHSLARTYRDTLHFAEALSLMNELFASGTVKPYQDGPRFVMATIYYEMDDFDNARKWFKEADQISKGRCFREEDMKYFEFYKK